MDDNPILCMMMVWALIAYDLSDELLWTIWGAALPRVSLVLESCISQLLVAPGGSGENVLVAMAVPAHALAQRYPQNSLLM